VNWSRVITAVILASIVIALILKLENIWFALICGLIVLLALWEWAVLKQQSFIVFLLSTIPLTVLFFVGREYQNLLMILSLLSSQIWIVIAIDIMLNKLESFYSALNSYVMGVFLMSGVWSALVLIHGWIDGGPMFLISVLLMIWAADCFAYLVGKNYGHRKLAPEISPGKTYEGFCGGVLGTLILALVTGVILLNLSGVQLLLWVGLGLFISVIGIIGDLYESRLKRIAGVKDSGRILPGHGGILDRIDSMIVAMPMVAIGWYLVR